MDFGADIRRGIPFRLLQGDIPLGTLAVHEIGREWLVCAFSATAAFTPLRSLFDTTSGRFADPPRLPAGDDAWALLRDLLAARDVRIGTCRGATYRFLLHIDGQKAWLRFGVPGDPAPRPVPPPTGYSPPGP